MEENQFKELVELLKGIRSEIENLRGDIKDEIAKEIKEVNVEFKLFHRNYKITEDIND